MDVRQRDRNIAGFAYIGAGSSDVNSGFLVGKVVKFYFFGTLRYRLLLLHMHRHGIRTQSSR